MAAIVSVRDQSRDRETETTASLETDNLKNWQLRVKLFARQLKGNREITECYKAATVRCSSHPQRLKENKEETGMTTT